MRLDFSRQGLDFRTSIEVKQLAAAAGAPASSTSSSRRRPLCARRAISAMLSRSAAGGMADIDISPRREKETFHGDAGSVPSLVFKVVRMKMLSL